MTASVAHAKPEPIAVAPAVWRVGGGSWRGAVPRLSDEADGNVYLLELGAAVTLVDCGTRAGRAAIRGNLRQLGLHPDAVTDVLLSHSHWDHADGVAAWQAGARPPATHLNRLGATFLARGDHRLVGYQLLAPPHRFEPFRVDHWVEDGERFALAETVVEARFMPGHTPDSTVYTFELDGRVIAVCGDIAFGPTADHGVALGQLCTLWQSSLDDYVESLRRLVERRIDVLLPGHGDAVIGRERVRDALLATLELASSLAADTRVRANLGV
jgi:glyoxylase-like metal-dependent hydrolase (beta-lactamase superfamily II)